VSGTSPDPRKSRPLDVTQAYVPPEVQNAPPLPEGLPKIPGITLHFEIARGGMGVVYSGRQDFLDRRVAVKLLSVELGGESFVQRFQREAKILAGIKHPNIVACHMAGTTDDGQSYLVMEYIDGPSLKKWITDHGPVSVPASLRLIRATAQALGHAHQLGIIHRDVKPENILLETVTSTALDVAFPFTPKVVDLGLARSNSGSASLGLTSPGSVMGTPATMSPEQYDEPDAVDFRSDIYGLGCVFYEMLVGQPAFRARKLTEIVAQKRQPIAPNPCNENATIPPAVGALVQSMLAGNRDERPRSYKELDERIADLIDTMIARHTRTPSKTSPPPVVGEETEWGTGPLMRPSKTRLDKPAGDDPFAKAEQKAKDDAGKPKTPSAGLLRTSEINFLAEGLGAPAEPPKPAFEDLGATVVSKLPPKEDSATSGAKPPQPKSTPEANPSPKKPPLALLVGGALVLGIGGWLLLGRDGGEAGGEPVAGGGTTTTPPKPKPAAPVIDAIVGADGAFALKQTVKLEAKVRSPGGRSMFAWSMPDELFARTRNSEKIDIQVMDGLPGVVFDVELEVNDGKGQTARQKVPITVADFPGRKAMVGFKALPEWRLDKRDVFWVDVSNDKDDFVACTANKELRTLSTSLDPNETYWEWSGKLTSEVADENGAPARIGVRAEFGAVGYTVVCSRTGGSDESDWTVDAHPSQLTQTGWSPAGEAIRLQFPNAPDEKVVTRGWFRLQRRRGQLSIEIGSAADVFVDGKQDPEVRIESVKSKTFDLPADAAASQLTLFVDQGRGEFRLRSR
jgi:serine/threonine protein kinase